MLAFKSHAPKANQWAIPTHVYVQEGKKKNITVVMYIVTTTTVKFHMCLLAHYLREMHHV